MAVAAYGHRSGRALCLVCSAAARAVTLHVTTTKAVLHALRQAATITVSLPPGRLQQLTAAAAMDGDTPEQAVRKLIDSYCSDFMAETRTNPAGRWATEPLQKHAQGTIG